MKSTITPYSPEWFKARCGTFTASEIYKLMTEPRLKADKEAGNLSEGANTYVLEKVHEKLTGITKVGIDNHATQWGVENEPLSLKWYGIKTGNKVEDSYLCYKDGLEGFSCTPDGFVNDDGLIETKSPWNGANHIKHCFITTDEGFKSEHPNYFWQCQAQMLITGRKWCDYVSFDPRIDSSLGLFIYRLHANEECHRMLIDKVTKARTYFNDIYTLFSMSPNEQLTIN